MQEPWPQSAADSQRSCPIHYRVARILWVLRDATGAYPSGGVDPPKTTNVSLAAVDERAKPLQGASPPRRLEVQCRCRRRFTHWVLAHVRTSRPPAGLTQPRVRLARTSPTLCRCLSLIRSNRRGTDPYARWCGRGGAVRLPPIPILGAFQPVHAILGPHQGWAHRRLVESRACASCTVRRPFGAPCESASSSNGHTAPQPQASFTSLPVPVEGLSADRRFA